MRKEQHTAAQETAHLSRDITLFGGVNILVGIMVGSGIFYLGSYVLMRSGFSQGLSLLVWAIGGLITLLSGLCYGELGASFPQAGGSYVYLREAYGKAVAFSSGFSGFILGSSGSIAALALAFSSILNQFISLSPLQGKLIAVVLIIGLSVVNYYGVRLGSWVQNLFTISKLVPILLILGAGLLLGTQPVQFALPSSISISQMIGMVAFAVVATLWAYEGWMNLNTVGEELKNPQRNIPLALVIAISLVTVLYVLFQFAIYRVVSYDQIMQSLAEGNYFLGTLAANQLFGFAGTVLVGAGMLISIFGATNGCIMVFPRSYYAMALDGLFFKQIAAVNPQTKTPGNAIVLSAAVSILLVFMRNLDQLTSLVTFQGLVYNAFIFLAVIIFRNKYPQQARPYKVIGYPLTPLLAVFVMVGLLVNTLLSDPVTSIVGLVIPLFAFVLYFFIHKTKETAAYANNSI